MQWPWISRKRAKRELEERELAIKEKHKAEINDVKKRFIERLRVQDDVFANRIKPVIDQILSVSFERHEFSSRDYIYMTRVEFDSRLIEKCLLHGDDEHAIGAICGYAGRRVEHDLSSLIRTKNMERIKNSS